MKTRSRKIVIRKRENKRRCQNPCQPMTKPVVYILTGQTTVQNPCRPVRQPAQGVQASKAILVHCQPSQCHCVVRWQMTQMLDLNLWHWDLSMKKFCYQRTLLLMTVLNMLWYRNSSQISCRQLKVIEKKILRGRGWGRGVPQCLARAPSLIHAKSKSKLWS